MQKQSIQKAAQAFREKRFDEALKIYQQLLACGEESVEAISYQNAGVCLRRLNRDDEALSLLEKGCQRYPQAAGIHRNIGNIYRDRGEAGRWRALHHYRKAQNLAAGTTDSDAIKQAAILHEMGLGVLAYRQIYDYFSEDYAGRRVESLGVVEMIIDMAVRLFEENERRSLLEWCLEYSCLMAEDNPKAYFVAARIYAVQRNAEEAIRCYRKGADYLEREKSGIKGHSAELVKISWNLACTLLRFGSLKCGWELYEFGLCTPTDTPQRWQRALLKAFSNEEIPVWQGEALKGKRLLVIGEQAVGDSMMFLSLLKELETRGCNISLSVQSRLVGIYTRTLPSVDVIDSEHLRSTKQVFDYQVPCGSLPRHLIAGYLSSGRTFKLIADGDKTDALLSRYRKDQSDNRPRIGISWLGGGRGERLRKKSINKKEFSDFLKRTEAQYISLQYGNVQQDITEWQAEGIDVIHDPEIDPLKDMDSWLSQVACCDMVVSVANTTIHGSGGLGIPTACLLSRDSDWRWVIGIERSYWYSSVECFTQNGNGSWSEALDKCTNWISSHPDDRRSKNFDHSLIDLTYSLHDNDN